jgi:hypothetical protein
MRIPKEQSAKSRDHWVVGLQERTATALERLMTERRQYEQYDDTDTLWLTREGNPYGSAALKNRTHPIV